MLPSEPPSEDSERSTLWARVCHLSAGFEEQVVFRRVDFGIPRRGAVALLGPSGVGKSTLLRTLGRWNDLRPSFWVHGSLLCDGRDLLRDVEREEVQRRFALLQQKARLFTATVLDNAIAGARGDRQLSWSAKRDLACHVLDEWNLLERLKDRLHQPAIVLALAEQRMLALARLASSGASCLLVDEPLRDVEDDLREALLEHLSFVKTKMALVFTTHHQQVARRLADSVVLLADGAMVESGRADAFFSAPSTALGERFVRTGNCWPQPHEQDPEWVAHQQARADSLIPRGQSAEAPVPTDEEKAVGTVSEDGGAPRARMPSWIPTPAESVRRPGGFHWVIDGKLGGTQWPGLLQDESEDLDGLAALGVVHLVNLTEQSFPAEALRIRRIEGTHFPIVDMGVPSLEACVEMCVRVRQWLKDEEATVFHCRAGLGRTGTLLACMRVLSGESAVEAIERVRRVNHKYIQSQEQLDFIQVFEEHWEERAR